MRLFRRQFILAPRIVKPFDDWVTKQIQNGAYLSYCPELSITTVFDRDGKEWLLLGTAIQMDSRRPAPIKEIADSSTASIGDAYRTWAGRWLLIGNDEVHTDAAALLGCFYQANPNESEVWLSSSSGLLAETLQAEVEDSREICHGLGIEWFPPPRSRYENVRRLLPSQILDLRSSALRPRALLPNIAVQRGYEEILDNLESYLITGLRNVARENKNLLLPLTAGYDSRLLLAAAHAAGVTFKTYTFERKYLDEGDRNLPPKLASALGVEHKFIGGGEVNRNLLALYDRHTGGDCKDQDRNYIGRAQFDWCNSGDVILRGGAFEIGRCFYWKKLRAVGNDDGLPSAKEIIGEFKMQSRDAALTRSLAEWVEWVKQTPHEDFDWRDRFYLEQRLTGWLSSVEQSLDLIDADRFISANSQFYFAQVLQIAPDKRARSQHHIDLIKRMAPELLALPFNQPNSLGKKMMKRLNPVYVKNALQSVIRRGFERAS